MVHPMDLSSLKISLGIGYKRNESPTPLSALFYLYETAIHSDVYCNYLEGFRLLHEWLYPIEIAPFESGYKIPRLSISYELNEISRILKIHPAHCYQEYTKWISDYNNYLIQVASHSIHAQENINYID